ncbi:hypothetical protein GQR58_016370 [Nymphon striatum]|nr:hypothetical protein GQR58_016370 [Nymphon striatum]
MIAFDLSTIDDAMVEYKCRCSHVISYIVQNDYSCDMTVEGRQFTMHLIISRFIWLIAALQLMIDESKSFAIPLDKGSIHSRDYYGDTFFLKHTSNCTLEVCSNNGLRAATIQHGNQHQDTCVCQCSPNFKTFRDDTGNCVQQIQGLNKMVKKIDCNVINVQYLTTSGWEQLHPSSAEENSLFTFVKNKDRMFLQWNGVEKDVKMVTTHLVKVLLHCKQKSTDGADQEVRPCVSFRVAGTNVALATLESSSENSGSSSGRPSNYVIIGLSVGLLGLIYVIALFIFLSVRKRRVQARRMVALQAKVKEMEEASDANSYRISDHQYDTLEDVAPNGLQRLAIATSSSNYGSSHQVTGMASAIVSSNSAHLVENFQEGVPEENVCIEETANNNRYNSWSKENCDLKMNPNYKSSSNSKRIYFNPVFFDRDMLISPPPAAEEFARKIQEMICIAKARIKNKRYNPKLQVVPEDDYFYHDLTEMQDSIDFIDDDDFLIEPVKDTKPPQTTKIVPIPPPKQTARDVKKAEIPKVEEVSEKLEAPEVKEVEPLKTVNNSFVKIRKLCLPPPPPPPIEKTEAVKKLEETALSNSNSLSQFDLFRLDLENKIRDLNISRQHSRPWRLPKLELPVHNDKSLQELPFQSEKAEKVKEIDPKPNIPPKPIISNFKIQDNSGVIRSNAFKLSRKNILRKLHKDEKLPKDDQKEHLVNTSEDFNHFYDNVVKLDLSFEEEESVPKTTIHVNGIECQKESEDFSTKISIESPPTVIQVHVEEPHRGICEKSPYVRKKSNSSIVMITSDDVIPKPKIIVDNSDVDFHATQENKVPNISDKILTDQIKKVKGKCDEGIEDTNVSSDSAIEDTSVPNSPIDGNSEKSVVFCKKPKDQQQNICGSNVSKRDKMCHGGGINLITDPMPRINNHLKSDIPPDFCDNQKFRPVEMWLQNSQEPCNSLGSDSYGSQSSTSSADRDGSPELNSDDGWSNRTEYSFNSLPYPEHRVNTMEINEAPRSLPANLNKESSKTRSPKLFLPVVKGLKPFSPVKPPRKSQAVKRYAKKDAGDSGHFSLVTSDVHDEETAYLSGKSAESDDLQSPVVNVQDWLLSTDDDDDEKEIIPHGISTSSEFNPTANMITAPFAISNGPKVGNEIASSGSYDAENKLENIDGKKINSRKLNRRRPVKVRLKDAKRKIKLNRNKNDSDSDCDQEISVSDKPSNCATNSGNARKQSSKPDLRRKKPFDPFSVEKQRLVMAQETLLNQIANNLHKSVSPEISDDSSLEKGFSLSSNDSAVNKKPEIMNTVDRSKLDALLNGDISSNETIL